MAEPNIETKTMVELSKQLDDMSTLIAKRDEQITAQGEASEKLGKQMDAADARIVELADQCDEEKARADELEKKMQRPGFGMSDDEIMSIGEQFVKSDNFTKREDGVYRIDSVKIKGGFGFGGRKALSSDALSAGALVDPMRVAEIIRPPDRQFRLRDLLTVAPTSSGSIEYVEETGFANMATLLSTAAIATDTDVDVDATAGMYPGQALDIGGEAVVVATVPSETNVTFAPALAGGHAIGVAVTSGFFAPTAELAQKPEANIIYELKDVNVKTIAHFLPASRQILSDAAQLRAQIDQRLVYGLSLVEEEQVLYGDGVGQNIAGITTNPAIQTFTQVGPDTKIDAVRKGMTLARLAEYPVTGLLLNPIDWQDIELLKGSDLHYIWLNIGNGNEQRMFRVPVVDSTAIRSGEYLTGAFAQGATIYDRENASVRVAEQHADFFIKNMVAILAEQREALAVFRPEAFVLGTFL